MIYYSDSIFEPYQRERDLMHKLIYYFNPCLKFMFNFYNRNKFAQYGFNSCRQTAILGAAFCKFDLQDDCFVRCYEADFDDCINGEPVRYSHAYFRLITDSHDWLVDLSRTTKKLLFTQVSPGRIYPHTTECPDYYDVSIRSVKELPFKEMMTSNDPEWITGIRPIKLFQETCQMVSDISYWPTEDKRKFVKTIYESFTALELERNEF